MKQYIHYSGIPIPTGSNHYDLLINYSDTFSSYIRKKHYLSQSFQGSDSYEVANSQICS